MDQVFYGSVPCESIYKSTKKPCRNLAYWKNLEGKYVCGVHKSKNSKKLPKNPNEQKIVQEKIEKRKKLAEEARLQNVSSNQHGKVICTKLRMMKAVDYRDGFIAVFPNARHGNRIDGLGMPKLSPKTMGPVYHGQPGLPVAKNIENLHQFGKVFPDEVDENGSPKKEFYNLQKKMYDSTEAHRHKPNALKIVKGNKNIPLYSVWVLKDGREIRLSYFTSRQIYSHFYEKIAKNSEDFKRLQTMLQNGYNLQIVGYDGYEVTNSLQDHYQDISRPFGHEMVLYTMLVEKDPTKYPWRIFQTIPLP